MNDEFDITLTYQEILRVCENDEAWLLSILQEEVITVEGHPREALYSGHQLSRLRRAQRIRRDFEASAPATALILQLLDELEVLRKERFPSL